MVPGSGSGGGGGGGGVIDATTGAIVFPVMSGENQVISGIQAKSDAAGTTEHSSENQLAKLMEQAYGPAKHGDPDFSLS